MKRYFKSLLVVENKKRKHFPVCNIFLVFEEYIQVFSDYINIAFQLNFKLKIPVPINLL